MKRLITTLLVVFAAVCVVIAFVVSPVEAPQSDSKATKLAYEISTSDRVAAPDAAASDTVDLPAAEEAESVTAPDSTAAVDAKGWDPVVADELAPNAESAQPMPGNLDDAAQAQVPNMPSPSSGQQGGQAQNHAAAAPQAWSGQQPQDYDPAQTRGYEGQPAPSYEGEPGYQGESGYQGQPGYQGQQAEDWQQEQQPQEQWVRLTSTASMHANPTDEAAMLFAFPAGRTLRVVSQTDGWVEATDPQSAATGWIRAEYLQASYNGQQHAYEQQVYEEPRESQRGGWLRRNSNGFADMIERAFGGGH